MRTKSFAVAALLSLVASNALAMDPNQLLLNSMTNCPDKTNPMVVMTGLNGNVLTNPRANPNGTDSILVDMVRDLQVLNPMIKAATVMLGSLEVAMTYPAPGYGLVCTVKYIP